MAEKLGGTKPKTSGKPKSDKANRRDVTQGAATIGHNLLAIREACEPITLRFLQLHEQMASDAAGYMADINNVIEEGAKNSGIKKSVLGKELRRILRQKREQEKEQELSEAERAQIEAYRAAMVGTQFELFASGELAKPAASA